VGSQRGQPGIAVEEAFRSYQRHVYRFLLRKTGNPHDAEELTQRVFVDAATALGKGRAPPDSLLAWLYAIAERRYVDDVRRRIVARRGLRLLRSTEEASDLAYSREISEALRDAIGGLPAGQRSVVVMKVLEGRPFAEIAERLGITEAACKMRLSRAVAQIKEELRARGVGPGS
jgi:RNA polymerase sigma factor (sigma-70 family)